MVGPGTSCWTGHFLRVDLTSRTSRIESFSEDFARTWIGPANVDTEGPIAGQHLDRDLYDGMLQDYYDIRGYDVRGVPTWASLERLGLASEAAAAEAYATLS